jgi:cell shape-determining protein MreC
LAFKLKNYIKKTNYDEIFNFDIFNNWIKKQLLEPTEKLIEILEKYFGSLKKAIFNLEKQIKNTKDLRLKNQLKLQLLRLKKQERKFLFLENQYKSIQQKIILKNIKID